MNSVETLRCQSTKRIELIVWSGTVELLAFRLGLRPADLLAALARVQDLRAVPIKLSVDLANSGPVFSAVRRRLAAGSEAANGGSDGRLCTTVDVY